MDEEQKKKVGRPPFKDLPENKAAQHSVSLKPTDKKRIEDKFGSLTLALKSLLHKCK